MRIRTLYILLLFLFLLLFSGVLSQAQSGALTPDETSILEAINEFRRTKNYVLVVPNAELNQIAREFAADLKFRYDDSNQPVGDIYLNSAGENIDSLLAQTTYAPYGNDYVVDFIPARIGGIVPADLVSYLIEDSRKEQREVYSRAMARDSRVTALPLGSPIYREVGIGHVYNPDNNRHYYMLLFAARPGVLPVVITNRKALNVIAEQVTDREVIIRPHNENTPNQGNGWEVIGPVKLIHISEVPGEQACPDPDIIPYPPGWIDYDLALEYTLSEGSGLKTIYVQMCDSARRTLVVSAQVVYADPSTPSPEGNLATPLGLAQMTQTAAAGATLYAPLQPTVEAILTATANAPQPTGTPTAP